VLTSCLNIETGSTTTTTLRSWYTSHLELTPDQFHRVVNLATLEQVQTRLIHDYLGPLAIFRLEHSILLLRYFVDRGQGHQVLKAVASTRFDSHAQAE